MNILYISKLSGNLWQGPNNSIPAQIRAQSILDNVFWFNYNNVKRSEWTTGGLDCKNLEDIPSGRLSDFPAPFNNPDIVVFEEFYVYPFFKIVDDVRKKKIPYVIIPRSVMTKSAQRYKFLKKIIGNVIYFNRFAQRASAIQYLTNQERIDSGEKWNKHGIVIPNGINILNKVKHNFSVDKIRASYIGRIEPYQKGLDLLIDSIIELKSELLCHNFKIDLYGPDEKGDLKYLNDKIKKASVDGIIRFHDSVYGEKKREILLNTDVFIMTSRFEGLSMGMIEALAYGIPCLATTGTNMVDEIERMNAGWCARNDIESIKDALRMVLCCKNMAKKGDNALALSKQYSWDAIAKKTHEEYEKIISYSKIKQI